MRYKPGTLRFYMKYKPGTLLYNSGRRAPGRIIVFICYKNRHAFVFVNKKVLMLPQNRFDSIEFQILYEQV